MKKILIVVSVLVIASLVFGGSLALHYNRLPETGEFRGSCMKGFIPFPIHGKLVNNTVIFDEKPTEANLCNLYIHELPFIEFGGTINNGTFNIIGYGTYAIR